MEITMTDKQINNMLNLVRGVIKGVDEGKLEPDLAFWLLRGIFENVNDKRRREIYHGVSILNSFPSLAKLINLDILPQLKHVGF